MPFPTPLRRTLALVAVSLLVSFPARADEADSLPSPAPAGPSARVHISSPSPVDLHRRADGGATWEIMCASPCDRDVPLTGDYRITGREISPAPAFRLNPARNAVDLTVTTRPSAGSVFGVLLVGTGGAAIIAGSVLALLDSLPIGPCRDGDRRGCAIGGTRPSPTGPLIAVGVGTGAVVSGALMLALSAPAVDVTGGVAKRRDAFVREPTWWGGPRIGAGGKPRLTVPLRFSF